MLKQMAIRSVVVLVLIFTVLILVLPTPLDVRVVEAGEPGTFIVTNARLFDGRVVLEDVQMLVEDGLVAAVGSSLDAPKGVVRIDGAGLTILPGLIDAHTHTFGRALEDSLRFGVTTNLDMFMSVGLMQGVQADRDQLAPTDRADLFSAGTLATVAQGHGTQFGLSIDTLTSPAEAVDWVARRKAEGSDYIKLVYLPNQNRIPSLDLATAGAIIAAAHDVGLIALAHIATQAAAADMVNAGIDGLVHMFADERVSETFIRRALDAGIFIIPTLTTLAGIDEAGVNAAFAEDARLAPYLGTAQAASLARSFGEDIPGFDLSIALANTGILQAAGVAILAGSDAPNPGTTHGASLHHELELLVQAGLAPHTVLAAATTVVADVFNLDDRGRLVAGARADFIMVAGDPLQDITATRDIIAVYKNGYEVQRAVHGEQGSAPAMQAILGTFEAGLDAPEGYRWTSTDDGMAGGSSTARVSASRAGYLDVQVEVTDGFVFPWAGAFLGAQEQNPRVASLAGFTHLHFRIKGKPGSYRAMMFDTGGAGNPPTQSFTVSKDWQDISLALNDFPGFASNAFVGLAIVAGPGIGEFQYQIDDVILK